jgi:P4 family phage/plasmid primase-like protien
MPLTYLQWMGFDRGSLYILRGLDLGVFGDWAEKYIDSGFSVIPVRGKRAFITNWTLYCSERPSQGVLTEWLAIYQNSGLGVCLGPASGIIGVDLDTDDARIVSIAKDILPPSPVIKTGQKGWTAFYKFSGQRSFSIKSGNVQLFDILSTGRQTVLPPSVHPETNAPYRWTTQDSLLSIGDDLPALGEDVLELLAHACGAAFTPKNQQIVPSGRNDTLKSYVCALADNYPMAEIVNKAIAHDEAFFGENALFKDRKEFRTGDVFENANQFVSSVLKSVTKLKRTRETSAIEPKADNKNLVGFYLRHMIPREGMKPKIVEVPQYKLMAEHCFERKEFCFDDSISLRFDGKKWDWISEVALNHYVFEQNKECINPAHLGNFVKAIKSRCYIGALGVKPRDGLINVNNGIIDVKTGALLPHSHEYMFRYCAPVDYSPGAECQRWEQFLMDTFEGNIELIDLVQRLFGYILIGGRPFLHRAFVLYGTGRNGKSTFLDVLKAVLGTGSYSVVSMSKLDKEFSLVSIDGKLANIVEETPTDEINAEAFKNMVGGGEVQAAHKGFDEYSFQCNARFVFACNDMPVFKDKSVGLEDRLVFIPFNRYLSESVRDEGILDDLMSELPGIFNWAIEGARMVTGTKKLPKYAALVSSKELYRIETDPLYEWFSEELEIAQDASEITVKSLYARYREDCKENGNGAYSKIKFSKRLRTMVKNRCEELNIKYDAELKDSMRKNRCFNVVRIKNDVFRDSKGQKDNFTVPIIYE